MTVIFRAGAYTGLTRRWGSRALYLGEEKISQSFSLPTTTSWLTLAFLFAVLQAIHAVEFFFGRLTETGACIGSIRGGPGANGRKGL